MASTLMSVSAGCEGAMCGGESGFCPGCDGECTIGGGECSWCFKGLGKGIACGGEPGLGAAVSGALFKAERS